MQIYEYINFYISEFYQTITSIMPISLLYFPIHIILTCLLYNHFKPNNLKSTISVLSKSIFCASFLSIAIPFYGIIIARGLQGAGKYSMPIIVYEIQFLLIILFTVIFARTNFGKPLSWLYVLVLLIFSVSNVGGALYMTSVQSIPVFTLIDYFIIISILAIIQKIGVRIIDHSLALNYTHLFK